MAPLARDGPKGALAALWLFASVYFYISCVPWTLLQLYGLVQWARAPTASTAGAADYLIFGGAASFAFPAAAEGGLSEQTRRSLLVREGTCIPTLASFMIIPDHP